MSQFYLANTPLILTADDGTDYRVERGEVAELSDAQYEQVAAHVTPVGTPELMQPETQPETQPESKTAADGQPENEITPEPQPENEAAANADSDPAPQPEKAKRGKGDKAE